MSWLVAFALALAAPPASHTKVVTSTSIEIYEPIAFARGSDRLPAGTERTLAAIATMLDGNRDLRLVAVEAEVAPTEGGDALARQRLGMRRANLVRARLIALGVAPSRLVAQTANGTRPVIAFVILSRAGEP